MAAKKKTAAAAAAAEIDGGSDLVARIKPSNARESHAQTQLGITIRKVDGWVAVTPAQAEVLRAERMGDLNPQATPPVFDVVTRAEAARMDELAQAKADPAGTAANPRQVTRR
jgi:hypothetical protein